MLTGYAVKLGKPPPAPQIMIILIDLSQPPTHFFMLFLALNPPFLILVRRKPTIRTIETRSHSFMMLLCRDRTDGNRAYALSSLSHIGKRRLGENMKEVILSYQRFRFGYRLEGGFWLALEYSKDRSAGCRGYPAEEGPGLSREGRAMERGRSSSGAP